MTMIHSSTYSKKKYKPT
ncbi:hypothetical protein Zm00014a_023362 [Zea mays]|uniref:Uncharacterized protein n=1 Tax=Zea mays TaxID=4577 RepID=A0A3L6FHF0_MAIZE|nr:hypothetical protein Zm00014a_023362 [Zea mays]